jgi:Protein of unknown function (DUF2599)
MINSTFLNKFSVVLTTTVLTISSFSALNTQAKDNEIQIDKKDKNEISKIIKNIEDKDPLKPEKSNIAKSVDKIDNFDSNQGNLNINFDIKTKKIKVKNKLKGETVIGIPSSNEIDSVDIIADTIVFSGKNSKFETIVQPISGGFQQLVNIKSLGEYSPRDLITYYQVDQTKIKQVIDTRDASFPVVADPIWCGDFFFSNYWEDRTIEGGKTLRNFPTWCGRSFDTGYGFDEIINKAPADNAWPNENRNYSSTQGRSMYNQYRCHVWFASAYKSSYNIEPARPLVDWRTMVTRNFPYACNP